MRIRFDRALALGVCGFVPLMIVPTASLAGQGKEYALKAQMIRTMMSYISWPKGRIKRGTTVITLGILGTDPFGKGIDRVFRRGLAKGCRVRIIRFPTWVGIANKKRLDDCHAVFVARSERKSVTKIVAYFRTKPIWLISDTPGFAKWGTHINFFVARSRVKFETNVKAARRGGVTMSSKLLRLGRTIE